MKVGVMGAGAVGCYYGAMLARAGHEVVLVGRPAFAEQAGAHGLRLQHVDFDVSLPVAASADPAALAGADVVLFTVKSTDTAEAGAALATVLPAQAVVLSVQNGVDNAERLAQVLGRPVVPAAAYVAVEMAGPGHVRHHGRGELVIGDFPGAAVLAAGFTAAGIPVTVSPDIAVELWGKLLINCAYNALSALAQQSYGEMTRVAGVTDVMAGAVAECVAVAAAAGVPLAHPGMARVLGLVATMPNQRSSTAQDLARGRRTEIDHLNGHVVRLGRDLDVATPVNATLLAAVRMLEAARGV